MLHHAPQPLSKTTPPLPSRKRRILLSLDGGGDRGLSILLILREILYRLGMELECSDLLLCDCVDLIGGTGTGGLIALMLGPLAMPIEDAILAYKHVFLDVLSQDTSAKQRTILFEARLKELVSHRFPNLSDPPRVLSKELRDSPCKVFVCAMPLSNVERRPRMIRTYLVHDDPLAPLNCHIWEAARATTAVAQFFSEAVIGENGQEESFFEAGVQRNNNPAEMVLSEAHHVLSSESSELTLISIGTGHPGLAPFLHYHPNTVAIAIACENTADHFAAKFFGNPDAFFRLRIEQGLETFLLKEWSDPEATHTSTIAYLSKPEVSHRIDQAVRLMAESKGLQSLTPSKGSVQQQIIMQSSSSAPLTGPIEESTNADGVETGAQDGIDQLSPLEGVRDLLQQQFFALSHESPIGNVSDILDSVASHLYYRQELILEINKLLPPGFSVQTPSKSGNEIIIIVKPSTVKVYIRDHDYRPLLRVSSAEDLCYALDESWEQFKDLESPWADCIAELLQANLDSSQRSVASIVRKRSFRLLLHYAKSKNILPPSFFLTHIELAGSHPIAGGGYADVYKGRWKGKSVCLKALRVYANSPHSARLFQDFASEALLWRQVRHPDILPFLGVNVDVLSQFCLVSLFMDNGNIMEYLKVNPRMDKFSAIREIACGLGFLHSFDPPIIHGDIRGANVLVKDDLSCCIADFGLAKIIESQTMDASTSHGIRGSTRWLAPELFDPDSSYDSQKMRSSRDIYAFGCTALEILTEKPPFSRIRMDAAVIFHVLSGKRPPRPDLMPDWLWMIITNCWSQEPSARPSASDILDRFPTGSPRLFSKSL